MAFLFRNIFFRCRDIQGFVQKTDDITNSFSMKTDLKIRNISESEWILFKLGTSNVCQVRREMLFNVMLLWQLVRLQFLFPMSEISPFSTKGEASGATRNTWSDHIVLNHLASTKGVLNVWWRRKMRTSIQQELDCKAKLSPWQQHSELHFVSYLTCITGAKFEKNSFNTLRDILDFVIYFCTETICDISVI